jgi:oligoribonuclease NrnB/cAMP/cGMP phosphodiesterase (DHH superfamily)
MKCFYHSADLDGHCSGAIIKLKYPECEMLGINYGDNFPWQNIVAGENVFMVDFGLQPFSDMERLNKICKLHWIDHHKTALDETYKKGFTASGGQLLETGKAGCELTWEYIHREFVRVPLAVTLLGRYDVWDHSDNYVLPFQYGMRQLKDTRPDNTEMWEKLFNNETRVRALVDQGQLILDYETAQNEKFCRAYSFETEFNGMKVICANRGFCNSKLFDSVYDPKKHHMMVTFIRMKLPKRQWTVSMYSTRDDVDCGSIAKSFGGGGHRGAAGFQCEELPFSI